MVSKYFYAVRKGFNVGIYDTWAECSQQTNGFSGAEFKKFSTLEEAQNYINQNKPTSNSQIAEQIDTEPFENVEISKFDILAYTDGSYDDNLKKYSYGVVIVANDGQTVLDRINGSSSNPKFLSSRNVSGEIFGAIEALNWAVANGHLSICIYHDYEGVKKWISNEWKVNSTISRIYKHIYEDKFKDILQVGFVKVKGHSGDTFNDLADQLAKAALNNKYLKKTGGSWASFSFVDEKAIQEMNANIKNDLPALEIEDKVSNICKEWIYSYDKEKVRIRLYTTGKLVLQGKIQQLFSYICSEITSIVNSQNINSDELEQFYCSLFKTDVNKEAVENEYNDVLQRLPKDYPETIKNLIRTAIISKNTMLQVTLDDYSVAVFSILKALDCHMKHLLSFIDEKYGKKGNYNIFTLVKGNKYLLNEEIVKKYCISSDVCNKLEMCYNFYRKERNSTFHAGSFFGGLDLTRYITDKEEALNIFNSALDCICN